VYVITIVNMFYFRFLKIYTLFFIYDLSCSDLDLHENASISLKQEY